MVAGVYDHDDDHDDDDDDEDDDDDDDGDSGGLGVAELVCGCVRGGVGGGFLLLGVGLGMPLIVYVPAMYVPYRMPRVLFNMDGYDLHVRLLLRVVCLNCSSGN